MKKLILFIAALSLLAACARNNNAKDAEFSVTTFALDDTVQYPEAYLNEWDYNDKSYYNGEIDVPVTKNQALYDSIVEWMASQFVDIDEVDSRDLVELMEMDKESFLDVDQSEAGSSYTTQLKLEEVSESYVTYSENTYLYLGGSAHGVPYYCCVTFDRGTGRRFTYEMFATLDGLDEVVKEGIVEQDHFEDSDSPFPLPLTDPWILNDSVYFSYDPYEISPFSFGTIKCVIPYSALEPFLTEEGKSFFAR